MPSKVSESRAKYRVQKARDEGRQGRRRSLPGSLSRSVDELRGDAVEVKAGVDEIRQRLIAIEAQVMRLIQTQDVLEALLRTAQGIDEENFGWLSLAEKSFAFWDNAEDAMYDHL